MKRVILITILISMFVLLNSDMAISEKLNSQLDSIIKEMEAATLVNDHPTILKHYTEDLLIMPNFREPVRGKSALKKLYELEKEQGFKYHSFSSTIEKRWQVEGNIYEYGSFGMAISYNSVEKPIAYYGSYFQIWEKVEGSYKIKYAIWNLDHNPF